MLVAELLALEGAEGAPGDGSQADVIAEDACERASV